MRRPTLLLPLTLLACFEDGPNQLATERLEFDVTVVSVEESRALVTAEFFQSADPVRLDVDDTRITAADDQESVDLEPPVEGGVPIWTATLTRVDPGEEVEIQLLRDLYDDALDTVVTLPPLITGVSIEPAGTWTANTEVTVTFDDDDLGEDRVALVLDAIDEECTGDVGDNQRELDLDASPHTFTLGDVWDVPGTCRVYLRVERRRLDGVDPLFVGGRATGVMRTTSWVTTTEI